MPKYLVTAKLESERITVRKYSGEDVKPLSKEDEVTVRFVLEAKSKKRAEELAPHATKKVVDEIIKDRQEKNQESN